MENNKKEEAERTWKKRFFILLVCNIVIIVSLAFYLYSPIPETELKQSNVEYKQEASSEFVVRTTKENVNNLVNAYLDKLLANTNHRYSVHLAEEVQLFGELPIFSTTVPLLIYFDPLVQENGDLALKLKSISVGQMRLPNKRIMQYVSNYLAVPEWVEIRPDEEEVYVYVSKMDVRSNFRVAFEKFDLENNEIAFKIEVPYRTLGIETIDDPMDTSE